MKFKKDTLIERYCIYNHTCKILQNSYVRMLVRDQHQTEIACNQYLISSGNRNGYAML